MRFWLSGPRIFGIRPGITFRPDELFQKSAALLPRRSQGGFVYIISGEHGHLKIGSSENPNRRLGELRTGSSFPLAIAYAGALRCDGHAIEAAAHETLARYRLEGEWFDCPVDLAVAAIGAAAHRLGEPIASVDPKRVDEIVRMVAATNDTAAAPRPWLWLRIALGAAMGAIIAFLIFVLT